MVESENEKWEKVGTCNMHRWNEKCTWSDHVWDFSINLRLLQKQAWEKQNSSMWPELNCLRAGSSSRILWMRWWRIRFCESREFLCFLCFATWVLCCVILTQQSFVAFTQRSTECTSLAGHSSQHNITQHGMLPQHPTGTTKLMWPFLVWL